MRRLLKKKENVGIAFNISAMLSCKIVWKKYKLALDVDIINKLFALNKNKTKFVKKLWLEK